MSNPQNPIPGDLIIDASDVKVIDITPEQITKLTKVHEGFELAVKTILNLKQEDIDRAGINQKDIVRLAALFADDTRIGELLPAVQKLVELLYETRQLKRHEIGTILGEMAAQARRRADRVPNGAEVLGPVGELIDYQYGPGAKASATKEKEKEKADGKADGKLPIANGTLPAGGTP